MSEERNAEDVKHIEKEKSIIMQGGSVRAIIEGRKTQTRRVIPNVNVSPDWTEVVAHDNGMWSIQPPKGRTDSGSYCLLKSCPYGRVGEQLLVKESWATERQFDDLAPKDLPATSRKVGRILHSEKITHGYHRQRSSIHMPRWASRLTLELTGVRVERLQAISYEDAVAEGLTLLDDEPLHDRFAAAWDAINGKKHPWSSNPFCWVLTFKTP